MVGRVVYRQMALDSFGFMTRRLWPIRLQVKLSGFQLTIGAKILAGKLFEPFPYFRNGLHPPKANFGQRELIQAFIQSFIFIVFDESDDLCSA